jgi:UDP-N-acetylglucosamine 4-epimerase
MTDQAVEATQGGPGATALLAGVRATWLVTGAAGFIGSNLVETLLAGGQAVVGLDNYATGHRRNLDEVRTRVGEAAWARMRMLEADVRDASACAQACAGVDFVLHQAALGSVPRSLEEPVAAFESNVAGFVRLLDAARRAGVRRVVYASSSSVYGDHPGLPKLEDLTGEPLSPYAATKSADELFAATWARSYGLACVGLRYFNVFGPRQDPQGAYAAVIPRWVAAMLHGEPCTINGDGLTSRDFCYVDNAVQANVRAALRGLPPPAHHVFNVACGERTTLLELFECLRESLRRHVGVDYREPPRFAAFRDGDVRHSLASIDRARTMLGYAPTHRLADGIEAALAWYARTLR